MKEERKSKSYAKSPMVSVIIPTHNRANLLKRAIQSVLAQTYQNFELIVVDDNSTDNTKEVVDSFQDPRIRYIKRHEHKRGGAAARNEGVRAARGRYIAFLDDDDEWLPNKLELQVNAIEETGEVGLVYTGWCHISNNIIETFVPFKEGDIFQDMLLTNCIGNISTIMVKKACISEIGLFDLNLPRGVDSDFIRRIANKYKVKVVKEICVNVYIGHNDRITPIRSQQDIRDAIKAEKIKIDKFKSDLEKMPKVYSKLLRKIAVLYLKLGESDVGRKYLVKSISLNFLNLKSYLIILASLFGIKFFNLSFKFYNKLCGNKLRKKVFSHGKPF